MIGDAEWACRELAAKLEKAGVPPETLAAVKEVAGKLGELTKANPGAAPYAAKNKADLRDFVQKLFDSRRILGGIVDVHPQEDEPDDAPRGPTAAAGPAPALDESDSPYGEKPPGETTYGELDPDLVPKLHLPPPKKEEPEIVTLIYTASDDEPASEEPAVPASAEPHEAELEPEPEPPDDRADPGGARRAGRATGARRGAADG